MTCGKSSRSQHRNESNRTSATDQKSVTRIDSCSSHTVDSDGQWFQKCTFVRTHFRWQSEVKAHESINVKHLILTVLEAVVGMVFKESGQCSVIRWCCMERQLFTQVVPAFFTVRTCTAWNTGFDSHNVSRLDMDHSFPDIMYHSTCLVSQDDRCIHNKIPNASMIPVVNI